MITDWPRLEATAAAPAAADVMPGAGHPVRAPRRSFPVPMAYPTALAVMLAAVALRAAADPWLGDGLPYVTLFGAVAISARYGGRVAGGLAAGVGMLLTEFFFVAPRFALRVDGAALVGITLYAATCAAIIAMVGRARPTAPAGDDAAPATGAAIEDLSALQQSARTLRDADRRKDEFLAILAHELRTPLAPIRVGVELLRHRGGDPRAVDDVRGVMERQVGHMVRLVDDLLDVTRITRGQLPLRPQVIDLGDVLRMAIESTRPLFDAAGLHFTASWPDRPVPVAGDAVRLAQVVGNLLTNAAKYTERGGHVWLTVTSTPRTVSVAVRDTGIGLTPEQCRSVFEMFAQAAHARDRAQGGLGIGLALVQEIVTRHGGRVEARSDGPGRGSTFTVHLPVSTGALPGPLTAPTAVAAPCARRWRVLLVDDLHDAADSLAAMLTLMGHETRTAYDGRAALQAAEAFRPDLILLDIGLPILDGYEVARRIRGEAWGRGTVLVALTGWAQEDDRRGGVDAGFDHYWTKPVEPQVIEALLSTAPPM